TPNPPALHIVESADCGLIVPFGDPGSAVKAVLRLRDDEELRADLGRRGYQAARERFHWPVHAARFVAQLEAWAGHEHASAPEPVPGHRPAAALRAGTAPIQDGPGQDGPGGDGPCPDGWCRR